LRADANCLKNSDDGQFIRFVNLTLEDVIETIRLSDPAHADALHRRYCDFWRVDGELELNAPTFGPARPRTRQRRKSAARADGSAVTPSHSNKFFEDELVVAELVLNACGIDAGLAARVGEHDDERLEIGVLQCGPQDECE
jgi:hypothetical protein